jgi:hypothetical protein
MATGGSIDHLGESKLKFDIVGPFEVKRYTTKGLITNESVAALKTAVEEDEVGLSNACGCYVFGIQAGRGMTPYYAGQSLRRSIFKEAMNHANITKYNVVLASTKGTPVLFLVPWLTNGGKLRKPSKKQGSSSVLNFVEDWLIATALRKNKNLINNKQTSFLRKVHITGAFNAKHGEATSQSSKFCKMMGI